MRRRVERCHLMRWRWGTPVERWSNFLLNEGCLSQGIYIGNVGTVVPRGLGACQHAEQSPWFSCVKLLSWSADKTDIASWNCLWYRVTQRPHAVRCETAGRMWCHGTRWTLSTSRRSSAVMNGVCSSHSTARRRCGRLRCSSLEVVSPHLINVLVARYRITGPLKMLFLRCMDTLFISLIHWAAGKSVMLFAGIGAFQKPRNLPCSQRFAQHPFSNNDDFIIHTLNKQVACMKMSEYKSCSILTGALINRFICWLPVLSLLRLNKFIVQFKQRSNDETESQAKIFSSVED